MKNMRRRISLPRVLGAMASALLLVGVACTSEPPMTANTDATSEPSSATNAVAASEPQLEGVVAIRVDRDGTVYVNGEVHPVERVSEAVASLDPKTVVSLEAHQAVPYRLMAALQDQVRTAGLLRVNFTSIESGAQRSAPRDVATLLDEGLPIVLPESGAPSMSEVSVNPRNLLFLEVWPTGLITARRGEDPRIQTISLAEVTTLLRQELALNPLLIAVMKTHPAAEYRHMYDVLDAIKRAEVKRFSLQLGG